MIPLLTHIAIFLFLLPVGVRRLFSSSSLFLHNPSLYRAKPWHFSQPNWKNPEFFSLLLFLPLASFTSFTLFFQSSEHPFRKFTFLQQSFIFFLFWVLLVLILSREFSHFQIINEASTFLTAGVFFFVEYSLTGKGFTGVSSNVYGSLNKLTLICGCSCFYLSIRPRAFFADLFLSIGLVFKATWVLQSGLNLYTDVFGLKGCSKVYVGQGQVKADVKCDLQDDRLRAIAVMDLVFMVHAVGAFVLAFGVLLCLARNRNRSFGGGDGGGSLLGKIDSESLLMATAAEPEMD